MNWVVVPRYTMEPLWLVSLRCGHVEAIPYGPAGGTLMACLHCRHELGCTAYCPVEATCALPRPLR